MAALVTTGNYFPKGIPDQSHFYVIFTLSTAMAAADTMDMTLPAGVDNDCLPLSAVAYAPVSSNVRASSTANVAVTNHNTTSGVTRLTASGTLAVGTTVIIAYLGT